MMFIICDKDPYKAVSYLIRNTNKPFCLTQLRELCQLICSAGISKVYNTLPQAKDIQAWIRMYPEWTARFLEALLVNLNEICTLSYDFLEKVHAIHLDLVDYCRKVIRIYPPDKAIFRYNKEYKSNFPKNSLLCIENVVEEYKKYLKWKGFKYEEL